ncbi:hypothetical protein [Thermococcus sp. AM4]|uniref:hypothetical protein n=1 Tax=Thermococcus sp. (strain AM4) TaxID=246969 RepID=UPI00064E2769|nr:hypothetical protein [Thermococcus sp. AM4]
MVRVTVRAGRFRRLRLELDDDVYARIEALAKRYGFRVEDALKILLMGDFIEGSATEGDIEGLQRKLDDLERRLYSLEGLWSPLKFKTYYVALDNQNLAIQVSAMIAQNKRLREKLGMGERDYSSVEEKVRYYLNFKKD